MTNHLLLTTLRSLAMFMVDGDGFGWCQDFEPENNVFGEGHGFGRGYGFYKGNGSGDGCGYGYGFGFRKEGACGYETSFRQLNAQNKSMFLDFDEY